MKKFDYQKNKQQAISFPLGGIGSGCIGLAGNGRLIDWEIFNRPNKGSFNEFTHFAVKVEDEEKVLDARVLNGDIPGPYTGQFGLKEFYSGFGWGPVRQTMAGMPHFQKNSFKGTFPIATLEFSDNSFPGIIEMQAFNPFIPHKEDDSSIPGAFFEFTITNRESKPLNFYLTGVLGNPYKGKTRSQFIKKDNISFMVLDSIDSSNSEIDNGNLCLATDAEDVSYQEYWYRGSWFDNLEMYWKNTLQYGPFKNRTYEPEDRTYRDNSLLSAKIKLNPGESKTIKYIISWSHPTNKNNWGRMETGSNTPYTDEEKFWLSKTWKNYYAVLWKNSLVSAMYAIKNWEKLRTATFNFRDTLFSSTLPESVIDAVSANISILKSPTVWRLEDGTLYGWEGVGENKGSCEGSCTHVWAYAQALPFLFPKLSRLMREAEYTYNWANDGSMTFRLMLPIGSPRWHFRPAADGQFATIMKVYREWKICGDDNWLTGIWSKVKKSLEFTWSPENNDLWDPDKKGVLMGMQHHTLDMELFGPNSWLTGMYLGALKACIEMAAAMQDTDSAIEYEAIYTRGAEFLNENLFNGEYFCQQIDIKDKSILTPFIGNAKFSLAEDAVGIDDVFWNDEHEEIKYQIGDGVAIDQLLGEWHADIYGLGEIFNKEKTKKALKAIMKYNFINKARDHYNPCRIYSLNDESGVAICAWPKDRNQPAIPIPYSQETMHGFEYAVADLMIRKDMKREGLKIVKSIREKYDGEHRNPWNEIECGSNYARSMASYSLLLSYSGFSYDGRKEFIAFLPEGMKSFYFFWSFKEGWGNIRVKNEYAELHVLGGKLSIKSIGLPENLNEKTIYCNEILCECDNSYSPYILKETVQLHEGDSLTIR